jgi:hypothetical protein
MNGFDKYLEFQFGLTGSFYTALFRAIHQADEDNLRRLAQGFPEEVEAYKVWSRIGRQDFLARCTPDHPLVTKISSGEAVL